MNNILDLEHTEARELLLKEESYFNFDLPKYFKFSKPLNTVSQRINNNNFSDFYSENQKPGFFEGVNYKLFSNKDGEYAWRLFQLIHPALYVSLVNKITEKKNWNTIVKKFTQFKNRSTIECMSLPIVKSNEQESNKAKQIHSWWENVEQKSIILALEYDYIFHTDIVDCYGSIYTHSIPWALHTKEKAKQNTDNNKLIGNIIDKHLRDMSNGQTNGIPQGSVLMDFIAEMVLGYADYELTKKLINIKIKRRKDYEIIRYRDDYRIFVNNPKIGKDIVKELATVLSKMGMRLNSEKTKCSNDVINSSIKPDKLFWIESSVKNNNLQKQLLALYQFSKKYPNSGTLTIELQNFYDRIEKRKSIKQNTDIEVLVSILINIAYKNPKTYPVISAILSKFFVFVEDKKSEIIEKIQKRFQKLPNTEHLDLWLQRITLKIDNQIQYESNLCKRVLDDSVEIWNSNWLKDDFKKEISSLQIIDEQEIEVMEPTITREEVALFKKKNYRY